MHIQCKWYVFIYVHTHIIFPNVLDESRTHNRDYPFLRKVYNFHEDDQKQLNGKLYKSVWTIVIIIGITKYFINYLNAFIQV